MRKNKEGIAMIIVLWIILILTVLTTVTAIITSSDFTSTLNLVKRKRTIKSAESASEFVVSFLPRYRDLENLAINDTSNYAGDTVYGHKMYLTRDSSNVGVISPLPLIRESSTTLEAFGVNPVLTSWAMILSYNTGGLIQREGSYLAHRRIQAAASFSVPGGEKMMGHTMY